MTIGGALSELNNLLKADDIPIYYKPSIKAVIDTITLEQEPCDDCISRTELLSRIDAERKHLLDLKMDGAEHIIVHHARRIIEELPSVTPKASED